MTVAPKNPALHLIVSAFVPGVGTMMNGESGKGVLILVAWIISIPLAFVIVGIFTGLIFWIWGMIDAYTGAQKWNRSHNIIS